MREIKFRAFIKEKNKIIYSYDSVDTDDLSAGVEMGNFFKDLEDLTIHKGDVILMQFTGLKDKNGKEIYEGDIVKVPSAEKAMFVVYQAPEFVMKVSKTSKAWSGFALKYTENQFQEIIGNIYENKELFKITLCQH